MDELVDSSMNILETIPNHSLLKRKYLEFTGRSALDHFDPHEESYFDEWWWNEGADLKSASRVRGEFLMYFPVSPLPSSVVFTYEFSRMNA
jgi:hypothetical protein